MFFNINEKICVKIQNNVHFQFNWKPNKGKVPNVDKMVNIVTVVKYPREAWRILSDITMLKTKRLVIKKNYLYV